MLMNAPAVIVEILQALRDLYQKGEEHTVYINKLPLTEEDRLTLLDVLGDGQVRISLKSGGQRVEWRETGISGVWIGVFYDRDEKPLLETIEVCYFPSLAKVQEEDLQDSIQRLEERLKILLPEASKDSLT
ncbi:MAG: hydrogenase expression/formation protein [Acidobacteria bacterium]|jgi:hydrogenase-1 operon protein HyaF|nr:MAG: hydrogenase expression/formation protein [Acidobacteriota bacterium]